MPATPFTPFEPFDPRSMIVPTRLAAAARIDPKLRDWLERLPATIAEVARRWRLEVGAPFDPGGQTAWVAPARRGNEQLVLKLGRWHPESAGEAAGLRAWAGYGAVRLIASEELPGPDGATETQALLLERALPGTSLTDARPEPERDEVIVDLLRRLWIPAPNDPALRPLSDLTRYWTRAIDADQLAARTGLDVGLIRAGRADFVALAEELIESVLLVTDLHADNVLSAQRESWLMIDPKPYVGDRCYDLLQHLHNCDRMQTDPLGLVERMAELAEVDASRLRRWALARWIVQAQWDPAVAPVVRALARGVN